MKYIIYYVLYLPLIMIPFNVFSMSEIDSSIYTKPTTAFYSAKQAAKVGLIIYRDENGNEFEVTEVGDSDIPSSNYDDIIKLPTEGMLTYVRKVRSIAREGRPVLIYKDELRSYSH